MRAVREHQFTVPVMVDSYNNIRTLVSELVKKDRPAWLPVSKRPSIGNIHLTHPNAQLPVQPKLCSERTNETDPGPPVVGYS